MRVTEVRIRLKPGAGKLKAFCSVTFDDSFVVREMRLIEGSEGYFLAMPSKRREDRCPRCGMKNHLRARYCCWCGVRLPDNRAPLDARGRPMLHSDIAHPINAECRQMIYDAVIAAYRKEMELAQSEDYEPKELWRIDELADVIRREKIVPPPPEEEIIEDEDD